MTIVEDPMPISRDSVDMQVFKIKGQVHWNYLTLILVCSHHYPTIIVENSMSLSVQVGKLL